MKKKNLAILLVTNGISNVIKLMFENSEAYMKRKDTHIWVYLKPTYIVYV